MESAILGAAVGAVTALLLVALIALVRRRSRSRADLLALLAAAQREADDLRARLEELSGPPGRDPARRRGAEEPVEFLITDVGLRTPGTELAGPVDPIAVPDRLVLSSTLGEPLVKAAAFSHGLRRALSPAVRNRIWFEMRREVRASRRRRRRALRDYQRDLRASDRLSEDLA